MSMTTATRTTAPDRTSLFVAKADHRQFSEMAKQYGVTQRRLFRAMVTAFKTLPNTERIAIVHSAKPH